MREVGKKTFHVVTLDYLSEIDLYEMYRNMGGNKPNISVYYKHLALLTDFDKKKIYQNR